MNKIEMGKEYQTCDGRKVRVLCVDYEHPNAFVVIALVKEIQSERMQCYDAYGCCYHDHDLDLIPVPAKFSFTRWVNVFQHRTTFGDLHVLKQDADRLGSGRIACIEVTIAGQEGDGI